MKITKKVQGHNIVLEYKKVKKYLNGYTLYNVYKDNVFLYRTCLTSLQIKEIKEAGYMLNEEEVLV